MAVRLRRGYFLGPSGFQPYPPRTWIDSDLGLNVSSSQVKDIL